ncbi:DUF695 domain-containing protein [Flavobacterium sp. LC2016-23]|uniref:DUF695 domain-containing protein n=1 Tax=Flavobacterium sp. LC2016-23 TaxID=2666330 RepID=UPI0012B06CF7|nr:DUF695 domain-containing protein [Flavobacterium sp. LC2016-23]MRX41121.1 DUF695 domain-containing protein [Flavobacterium sp. LC2016-23]
MSFFGNILGKKQSSVGSYSDFWNWFLKNEKEFFNVVQRGENIPKGFFDKLGPKLAEIHPEIYFLAGMIDDQIAELVLTPDGVIKNIYIIEELVNAAPRIEGWKFTALKPAKNFGIKFENIELNADNLKFYPTINKDYPDEIDLTIVYDHFTEDKKQLITKGVYIFLDNYLGELQSVTLIDNMKVSGNEGISEELIPIEKLKDYLIWREKEFVEKYEGIRHNTEDDNYSGFEGNTKEEGVLLAVVNTSLLAWDKKASHPWVVIITIPFDGSNTNGMPDEETYKILDEIEDEISADLKDLEGYLNIGRETANGKREIFFACKEFRKPPKVLDAIIKKYSQTFEISYDIYKDKYWQSFRHYEQN